MVFNSPYDLRRLEDIVHFIVVLVCYFYFLFTIKLMRPFALSSIVFVKQLALILLFHGFYESVHLLNNLLLFFTLNTYREQKDYLFLTVIYHKDPVKCAAHSPYYSEAHLFKSSKTTQVLIQVSEGKTVPFTYKKCLGLESADVKWNRKCYR